MPVSRKCLYALATTLAVCSALEGAARLLRHVRESSGPRARASRLTVRDNVLHHKWLPSIRKLDDARGVPYWLITNRQAWVEEYDVQQRKPADTYRIFYVGDSNVEGVVAPEFKMVERVEQALNRRAAGRQPHFEVINAGTSSYSFLLYYLQLKTEILAYHPDLVVLNIDMTDVVNDYVYRKTAVLDAAGDVVAVLPSAHIDTAQYRMTPAGLMKLSVTAPLQHWLVNRSAFCYYLDRSVSCLHGGTHADVAVSGLLDERANWLAHEWTPETRRSVQQSMAVLRRTIALLRSRNVKVMVTGVPHHPQYTGAWSARPHAVLKALCHSMQVPYLDSYAALKEHIQDSPQARYYWPDDPTHFNCEGNRIWAQAHTGFLLDARHGLLP